jgi:eukaryotic-like serine/threonine-protein kinase
VTEALVGETVDTRYELKRLIARGGMGLVFEAHHKFTRRSVALKLLTDEQRDQKETRRRLLREAHALTTVRHPGFVEVLDAGVCADHGPYVVLEMLEGRTLDGILAARRRLSVADTVQIGRRVCAAIAHAHAHGVLHRDVKPSNIFVARNEIGEETVKIIDLGVAAVAVEQLEHLDRKLTKVHEVLGTPEYMAPEQLWGQQVDARTDVYSIGMSLYECLTGDVPYAGAYPDVLVQVSNAPGPPDVRAKRRDIPAALAIVIENALEKDAGARFATAAELGRALVAAAAGVDLAPSSLLSVSAEDDEVVVVDGAEEERARTIQLVRRNEDGASAPASRPQTSPAHRRQFIRAPYVTPVRVFSATGSEIHARSEEISEEGMLVLTPLSFPLGAPLRLKFASPGTGEMIQLSGSVRWLREARGRSAMGIEFVDVPPVLRRVVADYVAMLPAAEASRA